MSLTIKYENVPGTLSSIGSNVVRFGSLALTQSADVGQMATSELDWDDPDGTWTLTGYRVFTMSESAAPSNNQQVYRGRLNSRSYRRGPSMRTGAGRRISVELMDQNVLLGWRVMKDQNANRPAETAGDRIRWLVNTRRAPIFAHPTYFANPTTAMDAADYRNQRYNDVLADIANVSGYNFWADYDEGRERTELFFMDPNGTDYTSTLLISNSLADVDSVTTFAPSEDAELIVDPSRIAASVLGVYDGGDVYTTRESTGIQFAYVDQTYELSNIKSAAKALALNIRYLDDNDTEDLHVTCSIIVPAASVNKVLHGQRISAKFTHLANEGLGDFTWYRITKRTVVQEEAIGLNSYRIALDLSPIGDVVTSTNACSSLGISIYPAGTYAPLNGPTSRADGFLEYIKPGIASTVTPSPSFAGNWNFASYGAAGSTDYAGDSVQNRIRIFTTGPGTITVHTATFGGVTHFLDAQLYHFLGTDIADASVTGSPTGTDITFTVPDDGFCYHYVDVEDNATQTGGKWGFSGYTWAPT